jgi:hypothetical protein
MESGGLPSDLNAVRHRLDQALADALGVAQPSLGQHERELVATHPESLVRCAGAREKAADLGEHRIAAWMAVELVDSPEAVHVEQHQ